MPRLAHHSKPGLLLLAALNILIKRNDSLITGNYPLRRSADEWENLWRWK
jgi:hypothetical protein